MEIYKNFYRLIILCYDLLILELRFVFFIWFFIEIFDNCFFVFLLFIDVVLLLFIKLLYWMILDVDEFSGFESDSLSFIFLLIYLLDVFVFVCELVLLAFLV